MPPRHGSCDQWDPGSSKCSTGPQSERNLRLDVSIMSRPQLTLIHKHHFLITRASSLSSGTLDQRSQVQSIRAPPLWPISHWALVFCFASLKDLGQHPERGSTDVTGIRYENTLNNCKICHTTFLVVSVSSYIFTCNSSFTALTVIPLKSGCYIL